jgi:hypothetical protein
MFRHFTISEPPSYELMFVLHKDAFSNSPNYHSISLNTEFEMNDRTQFVNKKFKPRFMSPNLQTMLELSRKLALWGSFGSNIIYNRHYNESGANALKLFLSVNYGFS